MKINRQLVFAKKYILVEETPHSIIFYFEK